MKALVLKEYNNLQLMDVPIPTVGPKDVLINVKACGICGSDVHGVDGSTGRRIPPIIMGHEASGVIAEVGSAVKGWKPGDRVTFSPTVHCGKCWFCKRGQYNLCDNRRVVGVSSPESKQDGAYAEYVALPQDILYKIPDSVNFTQAAMVEPLSIALHAVNLAPLTPHDSAVVIGAGAIGLLVVQALKAAGCRKIIALDVDQRRLDMAGKLGAKNLVNPKISDATEEILKLTEGRGADVVIEAVGSAVTINTAIACARKGGWVTLVGNLSATVEFPVLSAVTREIAVCGSCIASSEYPHSLDLIASGAVDVDSVISAVAPLSDAVEWFGRLQNRDPELIKVILQP